MNAWSNIEISRGNAEISGINKLEEALGNYPEHVRKVRELITRFEVCHFKYLQHLKNIRNSIKNLQPYTDPGDIGQNHIQHGAEALRSDKTGRTIMGQQYLWALHNWLDNSNIRKNIRAELIKINDWLMSRKAAGIEGRDQDELARIWLFACLAKTIKEQVRLKYKIALPGNK
jgi:hypothetical protein